MKEAGDQTNNNPSFTLSSPTTQDIVNWVHRGYVFLQDLMIQLSFEVCRVTTANPRLLCKVDFLKRIMPNVEVESNQTGIFKEFFENYNKVLFV